VNNKVFVSGQNFITWAEAKKVKILPKKRWWPFSYTKAKNGIFLDKTELNG